MSDITDNQTPTTEPDAADAAALFGASDPADAAEVEETVSPSEAPTEAESEAEADDPSTSAEPEEAVADEAPSDEAPSEGDADPATEAEAPVMTEADLFEDEPVYQNPNDRPGKWYVCHTQSGYEKKVKQNLEARIASMSMEDNIYEVVIPMEDVVEFRQGKKVVVPKKMFPGYLLVRCRLTDDAWYVIRNTPGVTGFVGAGNKPTPLRRRDVENFLGSKPDDAETAQKRSKPRLEYEMGETVRVREGPFADFSGEVIEINEDQLKVKVLVNIFGRETPVELGFAQVAKL